MADFLVGYVASFTQQGIQYDDERYHYVGLYAQDNWKVTPHLSINYGIRWEPFIGGSIATGYVQHFSQALFNQNVHSTIYPNAPAGLEFPGDAGFNTARRPSNTHLNDFAPRLGMVWDPKGDGRMTIHVPRREYFMSCLIRCLHTGSRRLLRGARISAGPMYFSTTHLDRGRTTARHFRAAIPSRLT